MNGEVPFQLGKFLVIAGVVLVAAGLVVMAGAKFSFFDFGKLPGDFAYRGKNFGFCFPIVSCLVVSVVLALVIWVVSLLTRR